MGLRRALLIGAVLLVPAATTAQGFDHAGYEAVLRTFVREGGVDYAGLKADRAGLDAYVARVGTVSRAQFEGWNRDEQLAYLINAYNAFVLQSVLDAYPIRRSLSPAALMRPGNSVWQIDGFFDTQRHTAAGRQLTLDDIEHKLIRPVYQDARVHAALVCAARSCPPLRAEAFDGARLGVQLDDQARRFLQDVRLNRFEAPRAMLSEIFRWFGDDFGGEKGVLQFAARYGQAPWLTAGKTRVTYIDYDWNLNDAR